MRAHGKLPPARSTAEAELPLLRWPPEDLPGR